MSDFSLKMHQIQFRLGSTLTPSGSSQCPQTTLLDLVKGRRRRKRGGGQERESEEGNGTEQGEGKVGEGRGRRGRGVKGGRGRVRLEKGEFTP